MDHGGSDCGRGCLHGVVCAGGSDCEAHRVDWHTRYLELDAELTALHRDYDEALATHAKTVDELLARVMREERRARDAERYDVRIGMTVRLVRLSAMSESIPPEIRAMSGVPRAIAAVAEATPAVAERDAARFLAAGWRRLAKQEHAAAEHYFAVAVARRDAAILALRNVRALAAKMRRLGARASAHLPQDTIADHLLRYCAAAGVVARITREQ
jgi:hypothetical protein